MTSGWLRGLGAGCLLATGCGQIPSPLVPAWHGTIGTPNKGVLTGGAELPPHGVGYEWLHASDHHHGVTRFTAAIARAAATVARERPGGLLTVGDISRPHGGRLLPHLSHRSGRDADLLLYVMTLDGRPVRSPGFLAFGPDGIAHDEKTDTYYRFDVEREWLLLKALLEDEDAAVQWMFVHHALEAMLIEWAQARGECDELVLRAELVMLQPSPPAQPHDDHVHVRTGCTAMDVATGCQPTGPARPWVGFAHDRMLEATNSELVAELLAPITPIATASRAGESED